MCGLLAYLSTDADRVDDVTVAGVADALHCLHHRGPDDTGGRGRTTGAVLGVQAAVDHRRRGQPRAASRYAERPLPDHCSTARSTTTSSCARSSPRARRGVRHPRRRRDDRRRLPLLGRGGASTRLRGMFAFVIWDTADRHGVRRPRPVRHQAAVHLRDGRRRSVFASEKKALLPFALGGSEGDAGVDTAQPVALPDPAVRARAGTLHRASAGSGRGDLLHRAGRRACSTRRYYQPTFPPTPVPTTPSRRSTTASPRRCARASAMHMRADVPVGSFLSSGIDSTAIVALASGSTPNILTFTVGFDVSRLLRDRRRRGVGPPPRRAPLSRRRSGRRT